MSPIYTKKVILLVKVTLIRVNEAFKIVKNGILQHKSSLEKVSYFIGLCLLSKFFFTFVSIYLCSIIFNVDLINLSIDQDLNNVNNIRAYKLASVIDQIGTFLLPVLFFAKLISKKPNKLWLFKKIESQHFLLIIPLLIIIITISNLLLLINYNIDLSFLSPEIEKAINDSQHSIDNIHHSFIGISIKSYLLNILVMAIVPAFCEEIIFRGMLQHLFCKWTNNIHLGVSISAILFALLHFQFYNFLALLFIGFTFSYITVLFGTIWITIILHFLFNLFSLTNVYLIKSQILSENSWSITTWTLLFTASILSVGYVYYQLKRKNKLADSKDNYDRF